MSLVIANSSGGGGRRRGADGDGRDDPVTRSGPTLKGCTFLDNTASSGGGLNWCIQTGADSGTLTDCTFRGNSAGGEGGGLYFEGGGTLTNCVLAGNSAGTDGGGMYNHGNADSLAVINCTFVGNVANRSAGGMYVDAIGTTLTKCIFWDNRLPSAPGPGGGSRRRGDDAPTEPAAPPDEAAQIFGGMPLVIFSCIQGLSTFTGNGNIGIDPLFVSPGRWDDAGTPDDPADDVWIDGDYRLQPASPCIDVGDNAAIPPDETDIDGDGDTAEPLPWDLDG